MRVRQLSYDINQVKDSLTYEDMYDILDSLGAEPQEHDGYIVCKTICHDGDSHKLYWYENTNLFKCFTGDCGTMDIFELIQKTKGINLNEAVYFVVNFFNLQYKIDSVNEEYLQTDWKDMRRWQELRSVVINKDKIQLPVFDKKLLEYYPQPHILSWEQQHIPKEISDYFGIRYDPVSGAIIIPHMDENNRLIGVRERTLIKDDADKFGKYRPWRRYDPIEKKYVQYSHPLAFNLFGLYQAKENIKNMKVAIVCESEKAVLQGVNYLGLANDLFVAVCGSSISQYQFNLLYELGINELCISFDSDYRVIGDKDWEHTVKKLEKIYQKFQDYVSVSFLFDTKGTMLGYKDSPTDCGREIFMELWKNRVYL